MKHIIDEVPSPARQFVVPVTLLVAILVVGTLGFRWVEGASFFDSFYMALVTLTTVGYAETIELSYAGRLFNSFLILAGFTVVFVSLGMLSHGLLQLELYNFFEKRKSKRMMQKLSEHYIVCGLGRVGRSVIEQLLRDKAKVIAIDNSAQHAEWAREHDVPFLEADATLDETLKRAGAHRARGLVAAISSDAENVYITLSARGLNPRPAHRCEGVRRGREEQAAACWVPSRFHAIHLHRPPTGPCPAAAAGFQFPRHRFDHRDRRDRSPDRGVPRSPERHLRKQDSCRCRPGP